MSESTKASRSPEAPPAPAAPAGTPVVSGPPLYAAWRPSPAAVASKAPRTSVTSRWSAVAKRRRITPASSLVAATYVPQPCRTSSSPLCRDRNQAVRLRAECRLSAVGPGPHSGRTALTAQRQLAGAAGLHGTSHAPAAHGRPPRGPRPEGRLSGSVSVVLPEEDCMTDISQHLFARAVPDPGGCLRGLQPSPVPGWRSQLCSLGVSLWWAAAGAGRPLSVVVSPDRGPAVWGRSGLF